MLGTGNATATECYNTCFVLKDEKKYLLGIVGTLSEDELQRLVFEVLNPIDYNYMVTPKEIDFLIDKLSLLIGHGLNMALHSVKRSYSDV